MHVRAHPNIGDALATGDKASLLELENSYLNRHGYLPPYDAYASLPRPSVGQRALPVIDPTTGVPFRYVHRV
jgi:hypothetical protein